MPEACESEEVVADKRTAKAQKKREKDRLKRSRAKKERRGGGTTGSGMRAASSWPLGECWVSEGYDQPGAQVLAAFSRMHGTGRGSVAFFSLDLAEEGVISVDTFSKVTPMQVMGEMGQRSGEGRQVMEAEPALVVKLVHEARTLGQAPQGLDDAMRLFGDVRPEDCDEEFIVGLPGTDEFAAPEPGLVGRFSRWLFGTR